jgi:hypothetical protein
MPALIGGVIAAKQQALSSNDAQLRIGFNWSAQLNASRGAGFWRYLGAHGGRQFISSLDWIGLDAYPDTFVSPPAGTPPSTDAAHTVLASLAMLRRCYLPMAHIPAHVALRITENGYPTGPGRSDRTQASVLTDTIDAISSHRGTYGVTDYRWFDLRDIDSASRNVEGHYGLMRDDYSPKAAFWAYRAVVARLGGR